MRRYSLPLQLNRIATTELAPLTVGGGAIKKFGAVLLILDRDGRLFTVEADKITRHAAPDLQMNREAFLKQTTFPVSESTLRAFDFAVERTWPDRAISVVRR